MKAGKIEAPDWGEVEKRIYGESVAAIRAFAEHHPDEEVCYFAYDSDPYYGYVLICFDVKDHSITKAKEFLQSSLETARSYFDLQGWQMAKSVTISQQALPFCNSTADFKYHDFASINFEGWEDFANSEGYPQAEWEGANDYLEGNLAMIFWKVLDRLIEEEQFKSLKLASPFFLGYGYHDEDQLILRIINW